MVIVFRVSDYPFPSIDFFFICEDIAASTFWDSRTEIAFGHGAKISDLRPQASDLRPHTSIKVTASLLLYYYYKLQIPLAANRESLHQTYSTPRCLHIYLLCLRNTERSFGHNSVLI